MQAPSTWSSEVQAPSLAGLPSLLQSASSWGRRVEDDVGGLYGPGSLHFLWPELSHVAAQGSVIYLRAYEKKEMGFGNRRMSPPRPLTSLPLSHSLIQHAHGGEKAGEGR